MDGLLGSISELRARLAVLRSLAGCDELGSGLRCVAGSLAERMPLRELWWLEARTDDALVLWCEAATLEEGSFAELDPARAALMEAARESPESQVFEFEDPESALPGDKAALVVLPVRRRGARVGTLALRADGAADVGAPPWALLEEAAGALAEVAQRERAERERRAELARWQSALDAVADPVLVVAAGHRLLGANQAAREVTGHAGATLPAHCHAVCQPGGGGPPRDCPLGQALERAVPLSRELAGLFGDPEHRHRVASFPLEGEAADEAPCAVHVYRDVGVERVLAERLQRLEGPSQPGRLAAAVAHEIRNPLVAMARVLGDVRSRVELRADDRRVLGLALEEAERLNRIVADFLGCAGSAPLRRSETDVAELVRQTLVLVREDPRARAAAELSCESDPGPLSAWIDADRIRQVIWNLVLNAVQATGDGGRVRVGLALRSRAGRAGLTIRVDDDGPGVPASQRERVFEPFETGRPGGTGLGLPLARHVAALHGGAIGIGDSALGGACVSLWLPQRPVGGPSSR